MTVALQCTSVDNRFIVILAMLHSGFVGRTTEYVKPSFFVPYLSASSKRVTT